MPCVSLNVVFDFVCITVRQLMTDSVRFLCPCISVSWCPYPTFVSACVLLWTEVVLLTSSKEFHSNQCIRASWTYIEVGVFTLCWRPHFNFEMKKCFVSWIFTLYPFFYEREITFLKGGNQLHNYFSRIIFANYIIMLRSSETHWNLLFC